MSIQFVSADLVDPIMGKQSEPCYLLSDHIAGGNKKIHKPFEFAFGRISSEA